MTWWVLLPVAFWFWDNFLVSIREYRLGASKKQLTPTDFFFVRDIPWMIRNNVITNVYRSGYSLIFMERISYFKSCKPLFRKYFLYLHVDYRKVYNRNSINNFSGGISWTSTLLSKEVWFSYSFSLQFLKSWIHF